MMMTMRIISETMQDVNRKP